MAIANYTRTCAKNTPGNTSLFFTEKDNITSVTVTSGEISAVTMGTGLTFHEVQVRKHTIRRKQEETGNDGNISIKHTLECVFIGLGKDLITLKTAIYNALACGLVAVIKDANDQSWLSGWNDTTYGVDAYSTINATEDSGVKASDDEMGTYTLIIEAESGYNDLPFDTTQNAAIKGETATYITFN